MCRILVESHRVDCICQGSRENININPESRTERGCNVFMWESKTLCLFSAAKAAQGMQMSVNLSVCHSVCHTYLFVRFTSIFYNSKSDKLKLKKS